MYGALIAAVVWCVSVGGAYWYGTEVGSDHEVAAAARDNQIAVKANEAAASAVATAISRIEVKNVVIRQQLEKQIVDRPVFRDCRSGPDAVQLLNATAGIAAGIAVAPGSGQLPASGAAR